MSISTVLLILAFVAFLVPALRALLAGSVDWIATGLALWVASLIFG